MAERNGEGGGEQIGFFYYDWAQSQYKWTDDNHLKNFRVRKVVRSSSEVKDAVSDCSPMPGFHNGGNIDGEASFVHNVKLPLQDKDVNQLSRCKKFSFRRHSQENLHSQVINFVPKKGSKVVKSQSLCSLQPQHEAQEISKGHATMITVLQTRLLRLRAAQTLWHKDTNALIEYLLRMKDDSVLVDVMPFLTSRVREVSPDGQALSMGACLEMLPALERLLTSKFEDYVIAGLNMIREMIKRWWMQLKVATKKGVEPECQRCSRSVSGLYMAIVSLSAVIVKLSKRRGRVREKAVVVTRLLDLL
ncbi:KATNB1-like protein 1 [Acropora muricata]|uniref:KATNB1-like protein 1 n=1 Tax=Acropora muricata TaxID=159855 RepID=UPI001CF2B424|nr:KATNB1-like protein 1 isoform X1 [Acropora millepora]